MSAYDDLLPRPRSAVGRPGRFAFNSRTTLQPLDDDALCDVRRLLTSLRLPLPCRDSGEVQVRLDPGIGPAEAYRLEVEPEQIRVVGADRAGVRWAVQTLKQLMAPDVWRRATTGAAPWTVPCGVVQDAPALSWRGGMLDVARHFLPKHEVLRYIDLFAMHKLNRLQLHLTDDQGWRVESPSHPRLHRVGSHRGQTVVTDADGVPRGDGVPHGGYYSLADLGEIGAYAALQGVVVVPEIDLPGHASALLAAYPSMGWGRHEVREDFGVFDAVVAPAPESHGLLLDVIDEILGVLEAPYVHLGGDECVLDAWVADPRVRAASGDLDRIHGEFLRRLETGLAQRGRRAVVWDEALATGGYLPDTMVMAWRGDGVARRAAAAGLDVVRAPLVPTYLNFDHSDGPAEPRALSGPVTVRDVASWDPVPSGWSDRERARVVGAQFQCWSEHLPTTRELDYAAFPRASAFADVVWRGSAAPDLDQSTGRLAAHVERLAAAGVELRGAEGPRPWQEGGTGRRRRVPHEPIQDTVAEFDGLSAPGHLDADQT